MTGPGARAPFPLSDRPRLWGVAVSHYQVEGDDPCDWTDWEAAGRTNGGSCGRAADSWSRYEEDAFLAASLGANAFRFSVSWSRIEPRRGEFDDEALTRYRRLVDHLSAVGLEPVVTLFHYTHPRWFHAETPWTTTASVDTFARFAERTARALGQAARVYTVLNEPLVFVLGGFLDGQIPPGIADGRADPSRRAGRGHRYRPQHDGVRSGAAMESARSPPRASRGLPQSISPFGPPTNPSTETDILRTSFLMTCGPPTPCRSRTLLPADR